MTQSVEQRWQTRIERARELQDRHAPAAKILRFYEAVLGFQQDVARSSTGLDDPIRKLREEIDIECALAKLPELLALSVESGPKGLSARAEALQHYDRGRLRKFFLEITATSSAPQDEVTWFFTRTCLQPIAENLQIQRPFDPNYSGSLCPACDARPQLAVLRPEGEGSARWLQCSFCLREWLFRRLICPWCGEEDKEELPHYSDASLAAVRVDACDTCHRYLKAVDLTIDGHAVPLVDEVALSVLDVWAHEHGYTKIVPNLMGL